MLTFGENTKSRVLFALNNFGYRMDPMDITSAAFSRMKGPQELHNISFPDPEDGKTLTGQVLVWQDGNLLLGDFVATQTKSEDGYHCERGHPNCSEDPKGACTRDEHARERNFAADLKRAGEAAALADRLNQSAEQQETKMTHYVLQARGSIGFFSWKVADTFRNDAEAVKTAERAALNFVGSAGFMGLDVWALSGPDRVDDARLVASVKLSDPYVHVNFAKPIEGANR